MNVRIEGIIWNVFEGIFVVCDYIFIRIFSVKFILVDCYVSIIEYFICEVVVYYECVNIRLSYSEGLYFIRMVIIQWVIEVVEIVVVSQF